MRLILLCTIFVVLFALCHAASKSKSCSCVAGKCTCQESSNDDGNYAGGMAVASSGPSGDSTFNVASAGNTDSGDFNTIRSKSGEPFTPIMPMMPFGNIFASRSGSGSGFLGSPGRSGLPNMPGSPGGFDPFAFVFGR